MILVHAAAARSTRIAAVGINNGGIAKPGFFSDYWHQTEIYDKIVSPLLTAPWGVAGGGDNLALRNKLL